jgi:cytochrome c oxidase assembly protein Cox11
MKRKYAVEFKKVHIYYVEAENMDEAEDIALEMDADKENELSWAIDPVDEIYVERLD